MKNYIGLKNPLHWQNCEALFFENKLIGIFCSAAHCSSVSQQVWLNWKLRILQHIFFWACYFFVLHQIFFFWSFFKTFWTCIVPCTLHISEQMLGNINWPKKNLWHHHTFGASIDVSTYWWFSWHTYEVTSREL